MRSNLVCCTLLLALLPAALGSQEPDSITRSRAEYREAVRAYEAKDYPAFLTHARRARELRPAHGGVTYALASAYALTGDTLAALRSLRQYAALGYTARLEEDSDFASLRTSPAFAELERRLPGRGQD